MGVKHFGLILGALIKNKLRFDAGASTKKKVGLVSIFVIAYIMIEAFVIIMSMVIGSAFSQIDGFKQIFYLIILLVAAAVVLIFGVVHLISTLYLAKDTDFYSMLPVTPSTVFAAKTLFVYLFESVIVAAVALPAMIVYGVMSSAGVGYYFISVLCLPIVPALPLVIAAIFAVPVMFIARKVRNRNIVPTIFYCLMFCVIIALYIVPMASMSSIMDAEEIDMDQVMSFARIVTVIGYILYPYTALSSAAFKLDTFALGEVPSTAINICIFLGISAVLIFLLFLFGKFMYSQSAKANNQTDNSRAKKGEYRHSTRLGTLIKREYLLALRTPATMFQCFFTMLIPIVVSVAVGMMFRNMELLLYVDEAAPSMTQLNQMVLTVVVMIMPVLSNGAITSFSREGVGIEALKTLPIDAKTLVKAKIVAWAVIGAPIGIVCAIIINVFSFDLLQLFLSLIAFLCLPIVYIMFGVLWDMSSPKLSWNDPIQAVKHNTHATIGQFIGLGAGMVLFILYFILATSFSCSAEALVAILWSFIFAIVVAFSAMNVVMLRKVSMYYNKMTV